MSSLGLAKGPTQPARAARPRPWPASRMRRRIVDKARLGSLSGRRGPGGGIGRRAGFRYQWLIAVEVRVLSWAPYNSHNALKYFINRKRHIAIPYCLP